jgi:carbon monoxide dehydrogenase subunit G
VSVDSSFDLEEDHAGTRMRWEAEVDAAGLFSGLGSQALGPVTTHHAARALSRLADRIEQRAATK